MKVQETVICLGNQLFPISFYRSLGVKRVFMAEDNDLCRHFKYHKYKLILFLAAMRRYADELREAGLEVHYVRLDEQPKPVKYEKKLEAYLGNKKHRLHVFEIEDKFMEERVVQFAEGSGHELVVHESPMFLTSREAFRLYLETKQRPFMKTFYEWQRKRLKILVTPKGTPEGGKWSFDKENRSKLPAKAAVPSLAKQTLDPTVKKVIQLVETRFPDHPGQGDAFWLPTNREEALNHLTTFFKERFHSFGVYEDAIPTRHDFVFHSVLTPTLNLGLVTPDEVVSLALEWARREKVPLNSLEGFIRQIIGWREFIRGIYQCYSEVQDARNFFKHTRKLKSCWYDGTTGIAPLDHAIQKAVRLGYCHHIERLMILGNLMLLCEVAPQAAHAWFMEMFVDSSDWVMGPNVYGMALFSDGGIFATKPYICASNYLLKMSDFKRGEWCDAVDALFWSFLSKHETFFSRNPRLNMLLQTWKKRAAGEKNKTLRLAETVRASLTDR